jgi:hypothetical protein
MKILTDYQKVSIRLTDERLAHILEHPEMANMAKSIEETLKSPEYVVQSASESQVRLYYRFYSGTRVGDKYLCVVVKSGKNEDFVLTAYLTDRVKKGKILWSVKL